MPLQIIRQDITKMNVDAIVNTTNEEMVGYSGVDLAVHTIAGAELDAKCAKLAPLGLGQAKISGGYNLPCKYVIHTSGPIWRGGLAGESIILRSCYIESLKLAVKCGCHSVAFPLISSGVYCYPKDQVLKFAIQTITEFLLENELMVYICVYDKDAYTFSRKLFADIKAFIDDDYVDEHDEPYYDRLEIANMRARDTDERAVSQPVLENAAKSIAKRQTQMPIVASCSVASWEHAPDKQSLEQEEKTRVSQSSVRLNESLEEYLKRRDQSFQEMLFDLIDKSGMTDVECYKKANVDKRTFSKIKSNKDYKPSKQTAIAFAISLQLDLDETQALLATLGFTLSRSAVFDKIVRYFIQTGNYDIFEINEALFEFDQKLLGC